MIEQISLKKANISDKSLHLSVQKTYSHKQGNNHSLDRSEVTGSGKKLFKQKGTGNARAGMTSSPIWRSGGRAFPNRPDENYTHKINKKAYRAGMKSILSELVRQKRLSIIDIAFS